MKHTYFVEMTDTFGAHICYFVERVDTAEVQTLKDNYSRIEVL